MRETMRRLRGAAARMALLIAFGGFAVAALAQPPGPEGPPGMGRRGPPPIEDVMERHAAELGLDDATRAAIHEIAAHSRVVERPLEEQVRTLQEQMRKLLDAGSPSLDDVMQSADRIGAAETELRKQRLRTMLEVRALLSPEQRQKLVKIFEERKGRRKGFGGGPPPPPPDQE